MKRPPTGKIQLTYDKDERTIKVIKSFEITQLSKYNLKREKTDIDNHMILYFLTVK